MHVCADDNFTDSLVLADLWTVLSWWLYLPLPSPTWPRNASPPLSRVSCFPEPGFTYPAAHGMPHESAVRRRGIVWPFTPRRPGGTAPVPVATPPTATPETAPPAVKAAAFEATPTETSPRLPVTATESPPRS